MERTIPAPPRLYLDSQPRKRLSSASTQHCSTWVRIAGRLSSEMAGMISSPRTASMLSMHSTKGRAVGPGCEAAACSVRALVS